MDYQKGQDPVQFQAFRALGHNQIRDVHAKVIRITVAWNKRNFVSDMHCYAGGTLSRAKPLRGWHSQPLQRTGGAGIQFSAASYFQAIAAVKGIVLGTTT
jgi:hypothetical protein